MGQLYSYTQPSSSSSSLDMTSLLEAEAQLYKDEGVSTYTPEVHVVEGDDGMPTSCYWDIADTEELGDFQRQLRMVKEQVFELDQKLVQLQKIVCKKNAENAAVGDGFGKVVMFVVSALLFVGWAVMFHAGKFYIVLVVGAYCIL